VWEGRFARVKEITLISGNSKKYEDFISVDNCPISVHRFNVELTESQGSPGEVSLAK
jgi:hypothetical protein